MAVLTLPWKRSAPRPLPAEPSPPPPVAPALFAAAIQALPDAVLIVERRGTAPIRVLASNAAAQDLLHIRPEDDQLLAVLRHPAILAAVEDTLARSGAHVLAYDSGGPRSRALRVWTRPLSAPGRSCALILLRDETEARLVEQMRADFLANASHELRTPLASLAGFIETLQGHARDDPEARRRFLPIMSAQAKRMSRLIDDLLSLSRIELNEHVPPSGECDLANVARETVDGLQPLVSDKGVAIEFAAPPPGNAVIVGDRDQIAQVMQNLIDNAAKYSPEGAAVSVVIEDDVVLERISATPDMQQLREAGGGRLMLLYPEQRDGNRYVRVAVTDRGSGIAREYLPRLTERFYRVPGQKSSGGTGLGLAIVKHIVNRHRGALMVESAPGEGTAFTVYLPKAHGEHPGGGEVSPATGVTKPLR